MSQRTRRGVWVTALVLLVTSSSLPFVSGGSALPGTPTAVWPSIVLGDSALVHARALIAQGVAPAPLLRAAGGALAALSGGPAGPTSVAMTWDAADGYVLALAPNITGNYTSTVSNLSSPSQTWSFVAGRWTELHPASAPSSRGFAAMTYDALDGYVVLFGGVPAYGFCAPYPVANGPGKPLYNCYNDTWTYKGGSWTNITRFLRFAPPRYFDGTLGYPAAPQFVYDASDAYAVLYGANNSLTWGFSAGRWANLTGSAGTAPGVSGGMAYDALDGYVLYVGGNPNGWNGSAFACSLRTWQFSHGAWTDATDPTAIQPSARSFASLTYDPLAGRVLLFGGVCQAGGGTPVNQFDTWSYSGGHWYPFSTTSGPTARFGSALVFDPTDGYAILYGGVHAGPRAPTPLRDTWVFRGSSWASTGPLLTSPRSSVDLGSNLSLNVEGLPFDALANSQIVFVGLPPGCSGANATTLSCVPKATGTFTVRVDVVSGLGNANATALVRINADPMVRALSLSRPVTEPGVAVLLSTDLAGGTPSFSFAYSGLPPGCSGPSTQSFGCTPSATGNYTVGVTVVDAIGYSARSSATLVVVPDLAIASVRLLPRVLDLGMGTRTQVNLSGGVGASSLAYSGLPPGCLPANTTGLTCTPMSAGAYTVFVTATDSIGFSAVGRVNLTVNPDPVIRWFASSRSSATVGDSVTLELNLSGGTAPYTVHYSGLPSGCTSANVTRLDCSPGTAGTFQIVVRASDAAGFVVSRAVTLTVTPARSGFGLLAAYAFLASFGGGALVGIVILAGVVAIGVRSVVRQLREEQARQLVEELLESAPLLASEVDALTDASEPESTTDD